MTISKEQLLAEAAATSFRPEILEKVHHLLSLLEAIQAHPFLQGRLALKGGTALNLFLFDVPRLSVDIDLNYVADPDPSDLSVNRPRVEQAIEAVCSRESMTITRRPSEHAGGAWTLQYTSALGGTAHIKLDLNFMFRVPLWPVIKMDSRPVGGLAAKAIPVQDLHELAAGKLAALLARRASRDLFDAHHLLTTTPLEPSKLRLAFVLYGAMNRKDWRTVSIADVGFDPLDLKNELVPVIRQDVLKCVPPDPWAKSMITECQENLEMILPFTASEREFLDRILNEGEIHPDLLTTDRGLSEKIAVHPLLQWKALNVRKHKES